MLTTRSEGRGTCLLLFKRAVRHPNPDLTMSMHAYLRNHPPGGCFICLEHTTRGLNLLQLGGSLAAVGFCAYELSSERHEGSSTPLELWAMLGASIVAAVLALIALLAITLRCAHAMPCKLPCHASPESPSPLTPCTPSCPATTGLCS